jgi:hypothetical protein
VRLDQLGVAEILAVGEDIQHRRLAILARTDLVGLAVGDDEQLISRVTFAHDAAAGPDIAQLEPIRQRAEHVVILEIA